MTSFADAVAACARQAALDQRARLLHAVWDDVRGARLAVHQGALPEQLLENAVDCRAPLMLHAADLVCCPDGVWRVARDRVERHPGVCLLEAPVMAAFLPDLCRLLLGETLRLPSVPAWWLGDSQIWPALAAGSRRYYIRNALDPESQPVLLADLPADRRQLLQAAVDADPCGFVAGLNLKTALPTQHVSYDTGRYATSPYC